MTNCFFWNTPAKVQNDGDATVYESRRTDGRYRVTGTLAAIWDQISGPERQLLRPKFTTWIVDQHRAGIEEPTLTSDTLALVRTKRFLRHSERINRFFQMLIAQDFSISNYVRIADLGNAENKDTLARLEAWIEARDQKDASAFIRILGEANLLTTTGHHKHFLTPAGLERLEQAEIGGANSSQVFVAMWFGNQMDTAYIEGIAPAIEEAGFQPFRIDRKEHNNKIDDEIIAEIRRSRFMVADFTCGTFEVDGRLRGDARGGVYYEAGFAQGLGVPLIWTVHEDCIDLVHFDTRQFAHIVWSDPADLKQKLINRINATLP